MHGCVPETSQTGSFIAITSELLGQKYHCIWTSMLEVDQLFAKNQTYMFQSLLTIQFLFWLRNSAFIAQEQLDSTQAHEGDCVPIKPCLL